MKERILEKIVHKQILHHFTSNGLFHQNQHGFLKGRSCVTCLATNMDSWARGADNNMYTGILCLDMTAAFDLVDPTIMINKLEALGMDQNSTRWIRSYLTGRKQKVSINNTLSQELPVPLGVPQGSRLGPLLFTIYSIDMPECTKNGTLHTYADDSQDSITGQDPNKVNMELNEDAIHIQRWMMSNKLLLSPSKTEYMLATGKRRPRTEETNNLQLAIDGTNFRQNSTIRILGITVNRDLDFRNHIDGTLEAGSPHIGLLKELSQRLGMLSQLKLISKNIMLGLVNGIVISKIIYGIQVYGGLTESYSKKLQIIMNRGARLATGLDRHTPSTTLMYECNWLSFKNLVSYHSLLTFFSIKISNEKGQLKQKISGARSMPPDLVPVYGTEQTRMLKDSFLPRTISQWNLLPLQIRSAPTMKIFKNTLRPHLMGLTMAGTSLSPSS